LIKGKHPAIITEEVFLQANELLKKNNIGYKKHINNENLPLKQFIACECCGQPMTGYLHKKKYIYYYKCYTRLCHNNVGAKQVHRMFTIILEHLQLDEAYINLYKEQLLMTYRTMTEEYAEDRKSISGQLSELKSKYEKLEERYAFGEIDKPLFEKFGAQLQEQIKATEDRKEQIDVKISNPEKLFETAARFYRNLQNVWLQGDLDKRLMLQHILFPKGIHYDKLNNAFRTSEVNEMIYFMSELSEDYEQKIRRLQDFFNLPSPSVESEGFEPPDLLQSTVFKTAAIDHSASSLNSLIFLKRPPMVISGHKSRLFIDICQYWNKNIFRGMPNTLK
jgi:site-specific DNA recombinase